MKFYIAARFSRRPEAYAMAQELAQLGHVCVARWVMRHETHIMPPGLSRRAEDGERARFAVEDIADMNSADWCISLTEEPRGNGRGGRHVEFGFMLAQGKKMTIIGPRETVFHHISTLEWHPTIASFLDSLLEPIA